MKTFYIACYNPVTLKDNAGSHDLFQTYFESVLTSFFLLHLPALFCYSSIDMQK